MVDRWLLAFASVALLTTGFATWVIGTQKTSGDGQLHIGVDTAEDNSVELTFNLDENDNRIIVAEDAEKSSNTNLPIKKTVTPDWTIKIKELNVVVGETFYNSLKTKQDLKIVFELQKGVETDNNSVTDDEVGVRGGQEISSWNYIKLAKSEFNVTLPDTYPADGKIYDIGDTDKTFSFTWGSYFGGKAPSVFYKENEPTEGLREYYQKALKELQAMNKALDKGTLKLTATFDYGQQKVGE